MNRKCIVQILFPLILILAVVSDAAVITVSKTGGDYNTIQEAIDAANPGDEVVILDGAVYAEQVTIDSTKEGLRLKSEGDQRPTIVWKDTIKTHPHSAADVASLKIDYDQNGALIVINTYDITIEGIRIDAGAPYAFGASNVWDIHPFQHGNNALCLSWSGKVTVRDCEILNAFAGLYIKDRNNGGIYVNANTDEQINYFNGFGRGGGHLIENNRIHNNSWGVYTEAMYDLGSTFRYNLIYENHHPDEDFADEVHSLTFEGQFQAGGAFAFKEHMLSPLAIHNNTLFNNNMLFAGLWEGGCQHLVFNNIFGKPHTYWSDLSLFSNWNTLDSALINRIHHCIYSAQTSAPDKEFVLRGENVDTVITDVDIMTGLEVEESDSGFHPGNRITPFPEESHVRWFEIPFLSTDPQDPDFLVPDWDDPVVEELIVDNGWPLADIREGDGSAADLGAIPSGGLPEDKAFVTPLSPVYIDQYEAVLRFGLDTRGTFDNPRIKSLRVVESIEYQSGSFGSLSLDPIPSTDISEIVVDEQISTGSNEIRVDVTDCGKYAFFELIVEGTGSNGETVVSNVAFLPYRENEFSINITVLDRTETQEITEVTVGDTVNLLIEVDQYGPATIKPVAITVGSGSSIVNPDMSKIQIDSIQGAVTIPAIFTKASRGEAFINVTTFGEEEENAIVNGTSDAITVLADPTDIKCIGPKLKTAAQNSCKHITVYSLNGRVVYRGEIESLSRLKHNNALGRGVFLVRIHSLDGKTSKMKRLTRVK